MQTLELKPLANQMSWSRVGHKLGHENHKDVSIHGAYRGARSFFWGIQHEYQYFGAASPDDSQRRVPQAITVVLDVIKISLPRGQSRITNLSEREANSSWERVVMLKIFPLSWVNVRPVTVRWMPLLRSPDAVVTYNAVGEVRFSSHKFFF